ncbi:MAG: Na/Pi cotransporter family protein [Desulfuromonadales bacterium]|nr:Na/Pi cotransporter family protein [Desulfuromonadales bacterium]
MLQLLLNQKLIFGLIGGLGLFLFGMKILSEGLQKVAGNRMQKILAALTNNRVVGALVGIAVTAIIQSSSATTVMVVGFVNAGLMSLVQSIGVILGANIGTTVTAQLIAFKITKYALPAIGIGAAFKLFSRNKKWSYFGEILLGFGLLFFGLSVMKSAFDPLKASEEFRQVFMVVGNNHLLGVLIGAVLTVVVQSSSATIGITIALASTGLLSFEASVALILGENIGTTMTANLAAIGTNLAARRTAFAHFLFNSLGVCYMLALFPLFLQFVSALTPGDADFVIQTQEQIARMGGEIGDKPFIARHIANTHTMFNIVNTIIFLPMVGLLAKLSTFAIRGHEKETDFYLKYLDNRVLSTPPIALAQARSETRRMAEIAQEMVDETLRFLQDNDLKRIPDLQNKENLTDVLQKEITDFLVALSQKSIDQEAFKEIASMMNMINDLERVGDHCENLWNLNQRKLAQRITFSEIAMNEIADISELTSSFLATVVAALIQKNTEVYDEAYRLEDAIDDLEERLRNNHIKRLNTGECTVNSGLIYIDMLHNFEKIGDHTFNVAKAVVGNK